MSIDRKAYLCGKQCNFMIFDWFKRLFKKKRSDVDTMHSDVTASYSDADASHIDAYSASQINSNESTHSDVTAMQKDDKIHLEQESLQLGLAAGYTGRSIHDINKSLQRIETLMITREWIDAHDKSPQIIQILEIIKSVLDSHDRKTDTIFERLITFLDRMSSLSDQVPEPIKSQIKTEISEIEREIPLRGKMTEALNIIKETGEISYKDLTNRLGYKDVSSTRSLLTRMRDRTKEIESFDKEDGRWVRYIAVNP